MQMDDLRKQLEQLSTKNAEREEYVRIGHTPPAPGFAFSSFFVQIVFYIHITPSFFLPFFEYVVAIKIIHTLASIVRYIYVLYLSFNESECSILVVNQRHLKTETLIVQSTNL